MPNETEQNVGGVKVNRARLGSISVYEITEDELDLLERGSPNSTYFNFGVALLSISASFFISIFSTTITNIQTFSVFWIVALVSLILGAVLLIVWYRASRGMKSIYERIRGRMTPIPSVVKNVEVDAEGIEALEEAIPENEN